MLRILSAFVEMMSLHKVNSSSSNIGWTQFCYDFDKDRFKCENILRCIDNRLRKIVHDFIGPLV